MQDRYWRALLRYCVHHRAYIGCDLPEVGDEIIEEGDLDRIDDELEHESDVQNGKFQSHVLEFLLVIV